MYELAPQAVWFLRIDSESRLHRLSFEPKHDLIASDLRENEQRRCNDSTMWKHAKRVIFSFDFSVSCVEHHIMRNNKACVRAMHALCKNSSIHRFGASICFFYNICFASERFRILLLIFSRLASESDLSLSLLCSWAFPVIVVDFQSPRVGAFFAIFCYPPGPIQKKMVARSPFFNLNHFFI